MNSITMSERATPIGAMRAARWPYLVIAFGISMSVLWTGSLIYGVYRVVTRVIG